MEKITTGARLRELMSARKLRQVDLLNLTEPYCKKYGVRIQKSDISAYVNDKYLLRKIDYIFSVWRLMCPKPGLWVSMFLLTDQNVLNQKRSPARMSERMKLFGCTLNWMLPIRRLFLLFCKVF